MWGEGVGWRGEGRLYCLREHDSDVLKCRGLHPCSQPDFSVCRMHSPAQRSDIQYHIVASSTLTLHNTYTGFDRVLLYLIGLKLFN